MLTYSFQPYVPTLALPDALPICDGIVAERPCQVLAHDPARTPGQSDRFGYPAQTVAGEHEVGTAMGQRRAPAHHQRYIGAGQNRCVVEDRKSTRLNSSH